MAVKMTASDFDVSRLIVAGDKVVSANNLIYPIAIERNSSGYDGQYFWRLALAPLNTDPDDFGVSMHNHPEVRAQRIVYPVAAWLLSFGRGDLVPYSLLLVNILAIVALGWSAIRVATHFAVPPYLGLLIPFYPGFVLSLCRDTAEIIATAIALAALLAAIQERWLRAALFASLAVLTREATLLYLAGFGLVAAWHTVRTRSLDKRVLWCLCPVAVYCVWQAVIKRVWGTYSYDVVGHDDFSAIPLISYIRAFSSYFRATFTGTVRYSVIYSTLTCALFAAFLIFLTRNLLGKYLPTPLLAIPLLIYTGMALTFSEAVWRDPWGYVRIMNDFYVLGVVCLIAACNVPALRRLVPYVGFAWLASLGYVV